MCFSVHPLFCHYTIRYIKEEASNFAGFFFYDKYLKRAIATSDRESHNYMEQLD